MVETFVICPPHIACHPSAWRCISQNSHMVSADGCQTTRFASVPAAGCAFAGIGTASNDA